MLQGLLEDTVLKALEAKEEALDAEINRLDNMNEDDIEELRRKRLEQMKSASKERQSWMEIGHGTYSELFSEKEFFEAAKKSKRMVCQFYRPATWRCQIVDKHLEALAKKHVRTRFVKINAEKSPYLCDKLKIWCIPTTMLILDGKTEHSIVGFDEFGGKDDFSTNLFEERLRDRGLVD